MIHPARGGGKRRVNRMEHPGSEQCVEKNHGKNGCFDDCFAWEREEQIICDTCGAAIAPGDLEFYARSAFGPLMKLCAGCCAQEEPIPCDRCGTLIPPGVMPHLHVAGLPVPFLRRLCIKCWRIVNVTDLVVHDELLEQDSFGLS